MKLTRAAVVFASHVLAAWVATSVTAAICQAQRFGPSVVNGIEVYRDANPRSRIFGNRDFLTSQSLCAQWLQNTGRLEQALQTASAGLNPKLPSGVSIVRQSAALTKDCNAVANYAAGTINLNVKLPGNVFSFNVTTPGPLPQSWDPRVSIHFDVSGSAQVKIPAGPRDGLSMSPVKLYLLNVQPQGENLTGDIALAAAKVVETITGRDFLDQVTQDRTFEFNDVNRYLGPINSELAAQLPALEQFYDPETKVVVIRGPGSAPSLDSFASFKSAFYPDRYIRHRNSLGYIEPVQDNLAKQDATFKVVPGLAGRCTSFESFNYPNHFLRHQASRLKLAERTDDQLFRDDATFCMRDGLAGTGSSFESVNYPGSFIRHRNFELWLDRNDGSDLFKKDASFIKTSAFVLPPGPLH